MRTIVIARTVSRVEAFMRLRGISDYSIAKQNEDGTIDKRSVSKIKEKYIVIDAANSDDLVKYLKDKGDILLVAIVDSLDKDATFQNKANIIHKFK